MQCPSSTTTDIVDLISTVWRRRRSANYDDDDVYFDSFIDYARRCKTCTTATGRACTTTRKRPRRRSVRKRFSLKTINNLGQIVDLTARNSIWWLNYVACVDMNDPKFLKIFRNRFRLPYQQYLEK